MHSPANVLPAPGASDLLAVDGLTFDDAAHAYHLNGVRLVSVTQLVGRHKRPFDAAYWSKKKAAERGVTADVILAEWAKTRDDAAARGTKAHGWAEALLRGQDMARPDADPDVDLFDAITHFLASAGSVEVVAVEAMVVGMGVAGTFDLLARIDGELTVLDWKTNKRFEKTGKYGFMLPPVAHLDDCHWQHYRLQLSIYARLLRDFYGLDATRLQIVHLAQGCFESMIAPEAVDEARAVLDSLVRPF